MYCVAYKFTLLEDNLANRREFMACWADLTEYFKQECGALGSRLHGGTGGVFYGYAQWPSEAVKLAAQEILPSEDFVRLRMDWARLCGPSEIIFEGRLIDDRFTYDNSA